MSDLTEIKVSLAKVEAGIGHIQDSVTELKDSVVTDLAPRVRSLEISRSRLKGVLTGFGAVTLIPGAIFAYFRFW